MRTVPILAFAGLCLGGLMIVPARGPASEQEPAADLAATTDLAEADQTAFASRFEREVWPLLTRPNGPRKSCVGCHDDGAGNKSPLLLYQDAADNFAALLADGYFDAGNPLSLLAKVTHANRKLRMPPEPGPVWAEDEAEGLRLFVAGLNARRTAATAPADESFPAALLAPYDGPPVDEGLSNTFLGFRQLQGKVRTIFGDDWRRAERDLFQENLAQFGGADFVRRFDESTKASPSFLSALEALARDVASKAFLNAAGPFAEVDTSAADRPNIARLYRAILFRDPTEAEVVAALGLYRDLESRREALAAEDFELAFDLQVEDADGLRTAQAFSLPVTNDRRGLYQERVDQTGGEGQAQLLRKVLDAPFHFEPSDPGQTLRISNADTRGNVSVHGIAVARADDDTERVVTVQDKGIQLEGAWRFLERDGFVSCEDNDENKGDSVLTFPIAVDTPGTYTVTLLYRKGGGDGAPDRRGRKRRRPEPAGNVLVEVVSHDPSRLERPRDLPKPPPGEALFTIDETVDTIAWWDLKTSFRFESPQDHVELNNTGTKRPVVADAVRFTRADGRPGAVIIDDPQAVGAETWSKPPKLQFRPYNITGRTTLSDLGEKKGELSLRYVPAEVAGWDPQAFARVGIGYPGKADNETCVPIVVRAAASSPIVRVQHPRHAHVGAEVTLDASGSYNIQGTPLKVTWVQNGGPKVTLSDPHAPRASFEAPVMAPRQAFWEGLTRALIQHPDFLFTRPVSPARAQNPHERARLQLVKLALDLVGRAPTRAEVARLEAGASQAEMVDAFLGSQEFRDFYFHRIRLYLESQGTDEEDEPVRLWCYVAFHDRPFQEILTADYTVGPEMQKQERPADHGHTGILTTKGFIRGKPGLPHFNYPAQVVEKFLGYVFEVPPEIVAARDGITAAATTDPNSLCYSCHKILTPLAYQRTSWTDEGVFRPLRDGRPVDDTDRGLVASYPYKGKGMEAFALQAQKKERFLRTMINAHFVFYFGREMRHGTDERALYKRLWDEVHTDGFTIRGLIRALVLSPEYLDGNGDFDDVVGDPADFHERLHRNRECRRRLS